MALFSSVFRQLFECFAHFLRREGTPQRAQQCAAQELAAVEKLPEECEALHFTAKDRKCRRRRRKVVHSPEKLMEGGSELREAGEKKRKKRKRKEQKITEPMPLLVEVKPHPTTVRCSFLKPIEGELPTVTSVSGHLALPVPGFKPLPPVTKPPVLPQKPAPAPEDVLSLPCSPLQVDPPKLLAVPPCPDEVVSLQSSSSQMLPLAVPPRPTPATDEVIALRRPPSRKPQPFTSLFEPQQQLMLVDIEDEEREYVEYTGRTIQASTLLKSERPQTPEAEMKPRKMVAWLEKDSEVQEEVWASEGVEVQGPTPAHDEVFALRRPPSRKPQPFTSSLFESASQPSLVDIEDEESEYVENTGKTIRTIDLKAEMKPRKMVAWLEKDSEVQEEVWASEGVEVQGPTPAHDEVFALRRPPSRKPQPFTSSLFESASQPSLVDIEDEESEYVENTGKTIRTIDLKAEMKPRKMVAWLEKDSEVQEEVWASEGVEVQGPTPAHDEVFALRRPPSRKPQPFTSSMFESPSQLSLVDIEDEESEYVEYTGRTIWTIDLLKSEHPQTPELDVKPRKMFAWLEKESEVQEEAWADEVQEVQEFKEEEGDPSEMGDSKAIQGHSDDASQINELTMKLVCESSTDGPENETQHNVNVQKTCKRKLPFVLFTWVEEKVKKRKEKKIIKEREQREKQLLLESYMNDPKLKHLWINKHNHNYNSS